MLNKSYKVLLGFTEVAGYLSNLKIGLKQHGIEAGYINTNNYFDYKYDEESNPWLLNTFNRVTNDYTNNKKNIIKTLNIVILCILVFVFISFKYNCLILCSGSSLFRLWDIKYLKLIGFKIINISLGSDTRAPYFNGIYKDSQKYNDQTNEFMLREIKRVKKKTIELERIVDIFINYPQHCHFNIKNIINGMYIGFPITNKNYNRDECASKSETVKILHAPSRPLIKGSKIIRQIIDELAAEGLRIQLIEVNNVPNSTVIELISECDIVFDEIYSDMPLGALGAEAAFQSKAVLVGGYYAKYIQEHTSVDMIPPSIFVEPENLKDELRKLVNDKIYRVRVGKKLNDFVRNCWNPKVVSGRYMQLLDNSFDKEWLFKPQKTNYFFGYGLHKNDLRINIQRLLSTDPALNNLMIDDTAMVELIIEEHKIKRID